MVHRIWLFKGGMWTCSFCHFCLNPLKPCELFTPCFISQGNQIPIDQFRLCDHVWGCGFFNIQSHFYLNILFHLFGIADRVPAYSVQLFSYHVSGLVITLTIEQINNWYLYTVINYSCVTVLLLFISSCVVTIKSTLRSPHPAIYCPGLFNVHSDWHITVAHNSLWTNKTIIIYGTLHPSRSLVR